MKLFIYFFKRSVLIFILSFLIFSQVRLHFYKKYRKKSNPKREFLLCVIFAYFAVLALLLFTPNSLLSSHGIDLTSEHFDFAGNFKDRINAGNWGVNPVPFRTISSYIKYSSLWHSMINISGNIIIFLPLGFLFPIIYNKFKKFSKILILLVSISLFIEFIQFFIGRSVDIDDIILNTIGGILGFLFYKKNAKKYTSIGR